MAMLGPSKTSSSSSFSSASNDSCDEVDDLRVRHPMPVTYISSNGYGRETTS